MQRFAQRKPFWAALALCLGAGALRVLDMALWTDADTGFATYGPALLRCVLLALAVVLIRVAAQGAQPCPRGLQAQSVALVAALCGCGVLLAGGCALLAAGGQAAENGMTVDAVLGAVAAVGFGAMAWRAAHVDAPAPGAWPGLLPMPWLLWLAARRALFAPAAVSRLPATLRVLAVVAALVCYTALLRALFVPEQPAGRGLFTAGFACFLLCTCVELPLALWELGSGTAQPGSMGTALALGCLGLCGAVCAWLATDPETV